MEIVGGFMVMMSIISLFLAVVWLIMPFVVFAIKGKQDRTLEVLEAIEKRLTALEAGIQPAQSNRNRADSAGNGEVSSESCDHPVEHAVLQPEAASGHKEPAASPAE